ncbi:MAG: hypothetical protein R3B64_01310 [Candidatus Paceibacterota bacterium]
MLEGYRENYNPRENIRDLISEIGNARMEAYDQKRPDVMKKINAIAEKLRTESYDKFSDLYEEVLIALSKLD